MSRKYRVEQKFTTGWGLVSETSFKLSKDEAKKILEELMAEGVNPDSIGVIDKEGKQLGVIAQEIQEGLPDVVTQSTTGQYTVNPDNVTWYLVNAVKELSAEIEQLKSQINN